MGAKTAIFAVGDGDIASLLRQQPVPDPDRTESLVRLAYPGYDIEPISGAELEDTVYPPEDVVYALSSAGLDVICDQRLCRSYSRPLAALGRGRRAVLHLMHSVSDSLEYAIWEDGQLVRRLSLDPSGAEEDFGQRLDFEEPFWAGEHPVPQPLPGWPYQHEGPGPLPFHPLDLGDEALRHLLGFSLEGRRQPDDVDASTISMLGFRVTDPTGKEQALQQQLDEIAATMTRRTFRLGPDRTWIETTQSHADGLESGPEVSVPGPD